jgi:hypothetical protein
MTRSEIIQKAVANFKTELGVREVNDNSGKRVMQYQAATTLGGTHFPWCAALDAFVIRETEKQTGVDIPWSFSASCDVLLADAKARGLLRSQPQVGDIFVVRAKTSHGYSETDGIHTGAVVGVRGPKFDTVEGNTNNDGGREGVAVMAHERDVSPRYAFIRWIDGVTLPAEEAPQPWRVIVNSNGKQTDLKPVLINGTNYIAARDYAQALNISSEWNADDGEVLVGKRPVAAQPRLIDGRAYFAIRVLAEHTGKVVEADGAKRTVNIG